MSYVISPSTDDKYIVVTVHDTITRISARQQNSDMFELGEKLNIIRFLVDVTHARNTDTLADQYNFAYIDMRQIESARRGYRVAILAAQDDHSHDFIETVGRNSGLNIRLFRVLNEAIAHLLAD